MSDKLQDKIEQVLRAQTQIAQGRVVRSSIFYSIREGFAAAKMGFNTLGTEDQDDLDHFMCDVDDQIERVFERELTLSGEAAGQQEVIAAISEVLGEEVTDD